jgi:hypothetical protein
VSIGVASLVLLVVIVIGVRVILKRRDKHGAGPTGDFSQWASLATLQGGDGRRRRSVPAPACWSDQHVTQENPLSHESMVVVGDLYTD